MANNKVSIKLSYKGTMKKAVFRQEIVSFNDVVAEAKERFSHSSTPSIPIDSVLTFVWQDEYGDRLSCSNDKDIETALSSLVMIGKPLAFEVVETVSTFPLQSMRYIFFYYSRHALGCISRRQCHQ